MFALGLSVPIYRLKVLQWVSDGAGAHSSAAAFFLAVSHRLQTGEIPDKAKYAKYYDWADVICGDYHMIRRYMPDDLTGKILITNTITPVM